MGSSGYPNLMLDMLSKYKPVEMMQSSSIPSAAQSSSKNDFVPSLSGRPQTEEKREKRSEEPERVMSREDLRARLLQTMRENSLGVTASYEFDGHVTNNNRLANKNNHYEVLAQSASPDESSLLDDDMKTSNKFVSEGNDMNDVNEPLSQMSSKSSKSSKSAKLPISVPEPPPVVPSNVERFLSGRNETEPIIEFIHRPSPNKGLHQSGPLTPHGTPRKMNTRKQSKEMDPEYKHGVLNIAPTPSSRKSSGRIDSLTTKAISTPTTKAMSTPESKAIYTPTSRKTSARMDSKGNNNMPESIRTPKKLATVIHKQSKGKQLQDIVPKSMQERMPSSTMNGIMKEVQGSYEKVNAADSQSTKQKSLSESLIASSKDKEMSSASDTMPPSSSSSLSQARDESTKMSLDKLNDAQLKPRESNGNDRTTPLRESKNGLQLNKNENNLLNKDILRNEMVPERIRKTVTFESESPDSHDSHDPHDPHDSIRVLAQSLPLIMQPKNSFDTKVHDMIHNISSSRLGRLITSKKMALSVSTSLFLIFLLILWNPTFLRIASDSPTGTAPNMRRVIGVGFLVFAALLLFLPLDPMPNNYQ